MERWSEAVCSSRRAAHRLSVASCAARSVPALATQEFDQVRTTPASCSLVAVPHRQEPSPRRQQMSGVGPAALCASPCAAPAAAARDRASSVAAARCRAARARERFASSDSVRVDVRATRRRDDRHADRHRAQITSDPHGSQVVPKYVSLSGPDMSDCQSPRYCPCSLLPCPGRPPWAVRV